MRRVAVTGIGCLSSLGVNSDQFISAVLNGKCGIAPITLFDTEGFQVKIAAEVPGYDERSHFSANQINQIDRFAQFAILASREAASDSGMEFKGTIAARTAVVYGTGVGGQNTQDKNYHRLYAEKAKRLHPFTVPRLMPSGGASWVSMDLGITGPSFATTSACSSAGHAVVMAMLMIRSGMIDAAVTGGSEACITFGTIKAWEGLRVMAKDTCRPFSAGRGGMVIGEGAGTLVIEELEHAKARGAKIYAELLGAGMSSDANNLIQPLTEGAASAMEQALADAGIDAASVDYINAHGTGTAQNDPTETAAIRQVFGGHADKLLVSSTKSMHGHTLGASAALESIASIAAIEGQTAPPTANYLEPDPMCDLDYVPNEPRQAGIKTVMCNSFAFGGLNTVLVFSEYRYRPK